MGDISGHEKEVNYRFTIAYELIRSARLVKGKSDFSEKIGMHSSYYSKFEKNERAIPDYILDNLSQIFGISKEWLLDGEGQPFKPALEIVSTPSKKHTKPEADHNKIEDAISRQLAAINRMALSSTPMLEAEIKRLKEEVERFSKENEKLSEELRAMSNKLLRANEEIIKLLKKK